MAKTLETLHNLILVLGEHSSEAIGIHDHLVERQVLATWSGTVLEHLNGVHVVTQAEAEASLLGNNELVTSNQLNFDTERERLEIQDSDADTCTLVITDRAEASMTSWFSTRDA
jgi:hypothetical protein